jgi:hypothetical protein
LRRLFCILDFESFQRVFIDWTQEVKESLGIEKDQICVDGKTLRGSGMFQDSCRLDRLVTLHHWV